MTFYTHDNTTGEWDSVMYKTHPLLFKNNGDTFTYNKQNHLQQAHQLISLQIRNYTYTYAQGFFLNDSASMRLLIDPFDFERGRECCRLYFIESETGTPAIIVCCNGESFDFVVLSSSRKGMLILLVGSIKDAEIFSSFIVLF